MNRRIALVPAAGVGARFGADTPKQYARLAGKTVLQHTVDKLVQHPSIDSVVLVLAPADPYIDTLYPAGRLPENLLLLRCGGHSRGESVRNGIHGLLNAGLATADDWLLVHDAARCCLPSTALQRLLDRVKQHPVGGLLAVPVADTLKRADEGQTVAATVARTALWQAQTPQMFRAGLLRRALDQANLATVTDESAAIEALGLHPLLVMGDSRNFKLTHSQDALLAAFLLQQEQETA